jgi:prepilin-type N-terminal cleavage/methylation domain-containing protein
MIDTRAGFEADRRGYTLLELMTAMIVLGTATATIVPVIGWANAQRRAAESRQIAVLEASNIVERISAQNWDDVTPDAAAKVKLSPSAARSLRDPALTIRVEPVPDTRDVKRISLELRWKNREGDTVVPVRLTRFLYRRSTAP